MMNVSAFLPLLLVGVLGSFLPTATPTPSEIVICHGESTPEFTTWVPTNTHFAVSPIDLDPTKTYSMPLLAETTKGELMLSWTEKDAAGMTSFCVAFSKDKGKTFSEKKTIFSGTGVGNSRMMRAKVLSKKDGSFIAVFSNRGEAGAAPASGRGGGRSSNIVYCVSKDGGNTWNAPQSVDSDPKQGIVRGFFDAVILPNDEIAVAYLKDVANSTKHEERDLRLVVSKDGVMQPERLLDAVVCDCCPINLSVDASGAFTVVYRDNNDDIRDMARLISTDNATTFSKSAIVYNDNWKIMGCPHSGAISAQYGKSELLAWFSGSDQEKGIRLTTREGKKFFVLTDASAKNPALTSGANSAVMLWEQSKGEGTPTQLAYRKIAEGQVSETTWIADATNATNSTGIILGNQLVVAYEAKQADGKNSLKFSYVSL